MDDVAACVFPQPVSPVSRTVVSKGATRRTCSIIFDIAGVATRKLSLCKGTSSTRGDAATAALPAADREL